MLVKKLSLKALSLPLLLAFLYGMCLPALNSLLVLRDIPPMDTAVHLFNLCSIYYLYVFVGYFISQGGLQRLRTGEVAVLTVLLFALICGYQLYAYSDWVDYLVDYDFPLLLLCAMGLLELLRRGAEHLRGLRPVVTYLPRYPLVSILFIFSSCHYCTGIWISASGRTCGRCCFWRACPWAAVSC